MEMTPSVKRCWYWYDWGWGGEEDKLQEVKAFFRSEVEFTGFNAK